MRKFKTFLRTRWAKLEERGNFTSNTLLCLGVVGAGLVFAPLWATDYLPNWLLRLGFLLGMLLIFVGQMGLKANQFKLRVLGRPAWRRAKDTYREDEGGPPAACG